MKVKITENHIKKGHRCSGSTCPVALAIKEFTPFKSLSVGLLYIYIEYNNMSKIVRMPENVQRFISKFDSHQLVEPIEFDFYEN